MTDKKWSVKAAKKGNTYPCSLCVTGVTFDQAVAKASELASKNHDMIYTIMQDKSTAQFVGEVQVTDL